MVLLFILGVLAYIVASSHTLEEWEEIIKNCDE